MAANIISLPFLNPVKFVEMDYENIAAYLTKHFDDFLMSERTADYTFMHQTCYAQKWQTTDICYFQFESNYSPINISLIDINGQVVGSTLVLSNVVANKFEPGKYVFEGAYSFADIPEGFYYFKMTTGSPILKTFISWPLHVKAVHENTCYLEYSNSRYHGDVIFETGIVFGLRVEAMLGNFKPGGKRDIYEDEKLNPTVLKATPFRQFDFIIGGYFGIPEDMIDKLNWIWSCNNVTIDGKSFAADESVIEPKGDLDYPLKGVVMKVREGINRGSKIVSTEGSTEQKLLVVYNIESKLFGDISAAGANNTISIKSLE